MYSKLTVNKEKYTDFLSIDFDMKILFLIHSSSAYLFDFAPMAWIKIGSQCIFSMLNIALKCLEKTKPVRPKIEIQGVNTERPIIYSQCSGIDKKIN